MSNWNVMIIGAGKIGRMIATLLSNSQNYSVTVGDNDESALTKIKTVKINTKIIDCDDLLSLTQSLKNFDAVISAAPFFLTPVIAQAAADSNTHYFDLTEDVKSTKIVREIAKTASTAFMPQCGLAPGFVAIAAHNLAQEFDQIEDLTLRVGALPRYPTNALKYNLTWSTDGLINEYCNPCEALVDGKAEFVAPLEGRETFALDGVDYEAFNTSGGLGTLCETLAGKAKNVAYRTIRYPGHRDIMKMLLHDLKLIDRRDMLKNVLEHALPMTIQDVVMVFCTASGKKNGIFQELSYVNISTSKTIAGTQWSAIQITTAAGITTAVDLMRQGKISQKGFVKQEDISLDDFLKNEFGSMYNNAPNTASLKMAS